MKKARKGFTLVELLIVVAIIGVLAATMTMSSTDAIDSAGANNILSNLQSMRAAAMEMYMEDSVVASATAIALGGGITLSSGTTTKNANTILAGYLGKTSSTTSLGSTAGTYSVVGSSSAWYVVYYLSASDGGGLRTKLDGKADAADLFGATAIDTDEADCGFTDTYEYDSDADDEVVYVALKVR